MKNHNKQNSLDFKIINTYIPDATPTKNQIPSKTFRKKTNSSDSHPLLFLYNTPSTQNRYANKRSLVKKTQAHSLEKKSQGKPSNQRSAQKLKSTFKLPYQTNTLSTKTKLLKITQILMIQSDGQALPTMSKLYQANKQYDSLVQQWKRLQVYDEADDLIKKMVQNYTSIIQNLVHTTFTSTLHSISAYQEQLQAIRRQNQKLQSTLQYQTYKFNVQLMELQSRIYQQFQKNQWATFILNEIALQPFDLDLFVRNSKIYSKAKHQYMANNYFLDKKGNKNSNIVKEDSDKYSSQFIMKSFIDKRASIKQ